MGIKEWLKMLYETGENYKYLIADWLNKLQK